jgi:hypothetical protein
VDLSSDRLLMMMMYNATLRRFRKTTGNVSHILSVCSLSYTAYKAHGQYYVVICGLSGSTIFLSYYLINGTNFGKTLLNIKMCVLIVCTNFIRIIYHFKISDILS